jgi:segregation and condensation protein B
MQELKNIIESLLFVADETLTVDKIRSIVEATDQKEIRIALQELAADYESRGGGFYLSEVAGGFQLRSRPIYHEYIKQLLQPSPHRLSRAALETLAVIAYRQPIIRADIEHIRGVDCGAMLRQLMERKLIRVLGRKEIPGRPLIYATAKAFLELFELKDLSELPTPAEMEQMRVTAAENDEPQSGDEAESVRDLSTGKTDPAFAEDLEIQPPQPECDDDQKTPTDAPANENDEKTA